MTPLSHPNRPVLAGLGLRLPQLTETSWLFTHLDPNNDTSLCLTFAAGLDLIVELLQADAVLQRFVFDSDGHLVSAHSNQPGRDNFLHALRDTVVTQLSAVLYGRPV